MTRYEPYDGEILSFSLYSNIRVTPDLFPGILVYLIPFLESMQINRSFWQVPYHSLSWCKTWLGPKVNITRAPQVPITSS